MQYLDPSPSACIPVDSRDEQKLASDNTEGNTGWWRQHELRKPCKIVRRDWRTKAVKQRRDGKKKKKAPDQRELSYFARQD
jgi:hypothetical protein